MVTKLKLHHLNSSTNRLCIGNLCVDTLIAKSQGINAGLKVNQALLPLLLLLLFCVVTA